MMQEQNLNSNIMKKKPDKNIEDFLKIVTSKAVVIASSIIVFLMIGSLVILSNVNNKKNNQTNDQSVLALKGISKNKAGALANAAYYYFNTASTTNVTNTFTVDLMVNSGGDSINVAQYGVQYDRTLITLTSVADYTQDSNSNPQWAQATAKYNITNGTIGNYPGNNFSFSLFANNATYSFNGPALKLATITFTVNDNNTTNTANFSFVSLNPTDGDGISANDSQGTNVMNASLNQTLSMTVGNGSASTPTPTPTPVPSTPTPTPTPDPSTPTPTPTPDPSTPTPVPSTPTPDPVTQTPETGTTSVTKTNTPIVTTKVTTTNSAGNTTTTPLVIKNEIDISQGDGQTVNVQKPKFKGNNKDALKLVITPANGTPQTYPITPDINGNWSITLTTALNPGQHTASVLGVSDSVLQTTAFSVDSNLLPNTGIVNDLLLQGGIALAVILIGIAYKNRKKLIHKN